MLFSRNERRLALPINSGCLADEISLIFFLYNLYKASFKRGFVMLLYNFVDKMINQSVQKLIRNINFKITMRFFLEKFKIIIV